jgi:hypothetical protein
VPANSSRFRHQQSKVLILPTPLSHDKFPDLQVYTINATTMHDNDK